MPDLRTITIRRAATAALAGAMILTALPAATVMAAEPEPPPEITAAEWSVLAHMNTVRARQGMQPLRMATHVRHAARERSRSMKNQDYFGHTSPSGATAGTLLDAHGVQWSSWGENIGWSKYYGNEEGARWVVDAWAASPGHRSTMLDRDYNYVGIGLAREGATLYYTAILVAQRDHTPPKAGLLDADTGISVASTGGSQAVTIRWWGKDRTLATRSSGLRGFTVQYKKADGEWRRVRKMTKARQLTMDLASGTHQFRVRATDNRGNRSAWKRPLVVTVL